MPRVGQSRGVALNQRGGIGDAVAAIDIVGQLQGHLRLIGVAHLHIVDIEPHPMSFVGVGIEGMVAESYMDGLSPIGIEAHHTTRKNGVLVAAVDLRRAVGIDGIVGGAVGPVAGTDEHEIAVVVG